MSNNEREKISVLGRLLSMEMLLFAAGVFMLVSGIVTGATMQLFYGVVITAGSVILHFVRKKDWKKHWEEQEQMRLRYEQRQRERKEKETNDRNES